MRTIDNFQVAIVFVIHRFVYRELGKCACGGANPERRQWRGEKAILILC